jgi:hypothetical protein
LLHELEKKLKGIDAKKIEKNNTMSFGCIIARDDDMIFKQLSDSHQKMLKGILGTPYQEFKTSNDVSNMVRKVLEKMESTDTKQMMRPLAFISSTSDKKEYEDTCVMHKIMEAM